MGRQNKTMLPTLELNLHLNRPCLRDVRLRDAKSKRSQAPLFNFKDTAKLNVSKLKPRDWIEKFGTLPGTINEQKCTPNSIILRLIKTLSMRDTRSIVRSFPTPLVLICVPSNNNTHTTDLGPVYTTVSTPATLEALV